jgi:hypothetical protein
MVIATPEDKIAFKKVFYKAAKANPARNTVIAAPGTHKGDLTLAALAREFRQDTTLGKAFMEGFIVGAKLRGKSVGRETYAFAATRKNNTASLSPPLPKKQRRRTNG